jgi:RND family efflux transporter MFP subunit
VPAVLGADGAPGGPPAGPPPAQVRVAVVSRTVLQSRASVDGRLQALRRAAVAAQAQGPVAAVEFEEGDRVGGGAVLARIDDTLAKLALAQGQAQLASAKAALAEAQAQHQMAARHRAYMDGIAARGSATAKEIEDSADTAAAAEARVAAAAASVAMAEASVRMSEERVRRLEVRAPFDGVVVRKLAEVGQWLDEGTVVAELVSVGQIDAVLDVPERLVNLVNTQDAIEVLVVALDATVQGTVVSIIPQGANSARTFPVKVRFPDEGGRHKPGMSVVARIPTGTREELLTVPRGAIQRTSLGTVVWADVGGAAMPLAVHLLFGHEDRYAVRSIEGGAGPTLQPGMNVVVEGAERLFPGQPLRIEAATAAPGEAP